METNFWPHVHRFPTGRSPQYDIPEHIHPFPSHGELASHNGASSAQGIPRQQPADTTVLYNATFEKHGANMFTPGYLLMRQ